jgi:serine/threonine protein kinase/Flp pilus assembly protein TadD
MASRPRLALQGTVRLTSDRWQRVKSLFEQVLDLPARERAALLKESPESPSVIAEVRRLLELDEEGGEFLTPPDPSDDATDIDGMLVPGLVVGDHFRISGPLGRGGMGIVYRAEDTVLGRAVALKFLPEKSGTESGERLMREARAAASLNHPNICVVHETGEHQGRPFIVMELLQGQTLRQHIAAGRVPEKELIHWAIQIASALEAAHERGVIHRDIKPANIFITSGGQAKILDFGLAKTARPPKLAGSPEAKTQIPLTTPGHIIGTVPYMSPEQACGDELDTRTDIFSLGAVLYEMATGKQAFGGHTTAEVHKAVLSRTPPTIRSVASEISPDLERIISKAIEKDRDQRYQHAGNIAAELGALHDSRTVELPHQRPPEQPVSRRRRWWIGAGAALVAAAIVAFVWFRTRPVAPVARPEIVIAAMDNVSGDSNFDTALNSSLAADFRQSSFLRIPSEGRTRTVLRLMQRPELDRVTSAIALEVCQRMNDQAVVTGAIARLDQKYLITLAATDCVSSEPVAESKGVAESRDGVPAALDSVALEMRRRLESLQSIRHFDKPLMVAATSSLAALKAYSQARDRYAAGDSRGAIPFFVRATELDPKFAVAYADLGTIYGNLGEDALASANLSQAYNLRDTQMADEARFFIVATYHSHVTGNIHQGISNYQTWTQAIPKDSSAWSNLAGLYLSIGRPDLALEPAKRAVSLDPEDPNTYVTLSRAQMHAGQMDDALATCRQAIARGIVSEQLHVRLAELAFARGDMAALQEQFAWAKGKPAAALMLRQEMLADLAVGKRKAGLDAMHQSSEEYRKQGMAETAGRIGSSVPRYLAELGWMAEARAALAQQPADGSTDSAVAIAETGDPSKAEEMLRRQWKAHPEDTLWQECRGPQIRGAIELARHRPDAAIEALRAGLGCDLRNLDQPDLRGRAYLALRQPALAAAEFRKILDHRGVEPLSHHLPLAHLGLARAYAMQGDTASSRAEYQKLLDLWKDADPDIPAKDQASRELAALP